MIYRMYAEYSIQGCIIVFVEAEDYRTAHKKTCAYLEEKQNYLWNSIGPHNVNGQEHPSGLEGIREDELDCEFIR